MKSKSYIKIKNAIPLIIIILIIIFSFILCFSTNNKRITKQLIKVTNAMPDLDEPDKITETVEEIKDSIKKVVRNIIPKKRIPEIPPKYIPPTNYFEVPKYYKWDEVNTLYKKVTGKDMEKRVDINIGGTIYDEDNWQVEKKLMNNIIVKNINSEENELESESEENELEESESEESESEESESEESESEESESEESESEDVYDIDDDDIDVDDLDNLEDDE